MENAANKFEDGALVFAKVKGYSPWPAKVIACIKKKYHVYFYGTGQTGNVGIKDIFMYTEFKQKFVNEKTMKRTAFNRAVDEIENAMDQKDLAPIQLTEPAEAVTVVEVKQEPPPDPIDPIEETTVNENPVRTVSRKVTTKTEPISEPDTKKAKQRVQKKTQTNNKKAVKRAKPKAKVAPFNILNDLLMVYLPKAKCAGIKVYNNKPEFSNDEEERKWMEQARKDAEALKVKVETGQMEIDTILDRIILEPKNEEISNQESKRFAKELFDMEEALFIERDFIELCQQVRDSLGVRRANVGLCLRLMSQIKTVELNKLMLLRNPECVDTIRRMCRYNGNLDIWKMKRTDEKEFKVLAEKIRYVANEIYESFQKLFDDETPEDPIFWKDFCKKVEAYKENTKNIKDQVRLTMTEKNYNKLVEARIEEARILQAAQIDNTIMDNDDDII